MKFIPILFSTPMVQAIQEGRKTMTRRIFKVPKKAVPKYDIGDVLWVRETFVYNNGELPADLGYIYKSDLRAAEIEYSKDLNVKWKPSLFMPKAACRIFLQITDVRVERLQDISEEDAIAEGAKNSECYEDCASKACTNCSYQFHKNGFRKLWQSINGLERWTANSFVWVISFKRIDKPENFI